MDTRPGFSAGRNVRNSLEIRMNCVGEYTSLNIIPVAQALTNINAGKLFDGNRYCLLTHTLHFGIIVDSYTALS
jgi:hypothetical protein